MEPGLLTSSFPPLAPDPFAFGPAEASQPFCEDPNFYRGFYSAISSFWRPLMDVRGVCA